VRPFGALTFPQDPDSLSRIAREDQQVMRDGRFIIEFASTTRK
jgi:hypothetical protein